MGAFLFHQRTGLPAGTLVDAFRMSCGALWRRWRAFSVQPDRAFERLDIFQSFYVFAFFFEYVAGDGALRASCTR
jgi:hypothetical protein